MGKSHLVKPSRRDFITKIVPACSLMCVGGIGALAGLRSKGIAEIFQDKHKFDKELPRKLTNKQYSAAMFFPYIMLARTLEKELGKERTIEILKKMATEFNLERGQRQAKTSPDTKLQTYTALFKDPRMQDALTMEVIEDTEKAFEIKVTECLSATTFLDSKAGDIGYATVCWGDYAWAEGFNPKIKLVRDKTLMEGHKYCNHRYIWTG